MPQQLPRLRAKEIISILRRFGFILISQKGSHQKWRHPKSGKQVIVPYHKGKQLPLGTIRSIIEGSGISLDEFHS